MALTDQQVFDGLVSAGSTAVVHVRWGGNRWNETFATLAAFENGLGNLENDGTKRLILVITRQDTGAPTIPSPKIIQRS